MPSLPAETNLRLLTLHNSHILLLLTEAGDLLKDAVNVTW